MVGAIQPGAAELVSHAGLGRIARIQLFERCQHVVRMLEIAVAQRALELVAGDVGQFAQAGLGLRVAAIDPERGAIQIVGAVARRQHDVTLARRHLGACNQSRQLGGIGRAQRRSCRGNCRGLAIPARRKTRTCCHQIGGFRCQSRSLIEQDLGIAPVPRVDRGIRLHDQGLGDLAQPRLRRGVAGIGGQRRLELGFRIVAARASDVAGAQIRLTLCKILVALGVGGTIGRGNAGTQVRQLRVARQHVRKFGKCLLGARTIPIAELGLDARGQQVPDLIHAMPRDRVVRIARQNLAEQRRGSVAAIDVAVGQRGAGLIKQHTDIGGMQHGLGQRLVDRRDLGAAAEQTARFLQGAARGHVVVPLQRSLRAPELRVSDLLQPRQRVFVVGVQRPRCFVQIARTAGVAAQVASRIGLVGTRQQRIQLRLRQQRAQHGLMGPGPHAAREQHQNDDRHDPRHAAMPA